MKSKIIILLTLLSLQGHLLFSQPISVELSVTWEAGYDLFIKDSMVYIPKLYITYRNMSDTNYYFLKISESKNESPQIGCFSMVQPSVDNYLRWRRDYRARAMTHGYYTNQNFHVRIGVYGHCFDNGWDIIDEGIVNEKDRAENAISCNLRDIYNYVYHGDNSGDAEYVIESPEFYSLDISPEYVLDSVKNQFVFLKPNEVYIDTYNLIGFKMVEGCFTFLIDQESFTNYVSISGWDKNQSCFFKQEVELPVKVGEYTLYTGNFHSNKVVICFDKK